MRFADLTQLGRVLPEGLHAQAPAPGDSASLFQPNDALSHRFLFAEDFREMQQQIGILTPNLVLFCCADAECLHAPSPYFLVHYDLLGPLFRTYGRASALSAAVWESVGFPHVGLDPDRAMAGFLSLFAGAELGEQHVVFGAEERIEEALLAACSLGSQSCLFHHSCIGRVTGVDWKGISRRVEKRTGVSIVHDANVGLDKFHADLASQLDAQVPPREPVDPPRRLNLVGFRDDQGARDLVKMLSRLDFGVESQPIPDLSGLTLTSLQRADFQVLNPLPEYRPLYDDVFRRLGTPALAPAAPYGFERSLRWVKAIGQHGGVDLEAHATWRAYYQGQHKTYAKLQARARQHRVGVILSPGEAARAADDPGAPFFMSIPLLSLLEEAGFGIDLLLVSSPESPPLAAPTAGGEGRHSVTLAATATDVESWLADPERRLVYSDLNRDLRLTAHGNAPFSLLLFELGFEGACRTLAHLVRLCEMTYFHEYRRHRRWPASPLRR